MLSKLFMPTYLFGNFFPSISNCRYMSNQYHQLQDHNFSCSGHHSNKEMGHKDLDDWPDDLDEKSVFVIMFCLAKRLVLSRKRLHFPDDLPMYSDNEIMGYCEAMKNKIPAMT